MRTYDKTYLDHIDKIRNFNIQDRNVLQKIYKALWCCGKYYIYGQCQGKCKTEYTKAIYCNKEFCFDERCQEYSEKRRKARAYLKFLQICNNNYMGYWVFTLPSEAIESVDIEKIKELQNYIKRKFKREFGKDKKIIGRWHWYGDVFYRCSAKCKNYCDHIKPVQYKNNKKRKKTVFSCTNYYEDCPYKSKCEANFFPHLNLIIDTGKIDKAKLNKIRKDYTRKVNNIFNTNYSNVVVNYSFADNQKKKFHIFNYVYRNTFRVFAKNTHRYAIMLNGFRNSIYWGKFDKLSNQEIFSLNEKLDIKSSDFEGNLNYWLMLNGFCINCYSEIKYYKIILKGIEENEHWEQIQDFFIFQDKFSFLEYKELSECQRRIQMPMYDLSDPEDYQKLKESGDLDFIESSINRYYNVFHDKKGFL